MSARTWPAIDLAALLSSMSDDAVLAEPALGRLMVEYSCWQLHWSHWYASKPARRDGDYSSWIAEGRTLFDRRDELKRQASSLLRNA